MLFGAFSAPFVWRVEKGAMAVAAVVSPVSRGGAYVYHLGYDRVCL